MLISVGAAATVVHDTRGGFVAWSWLLVVSTARGTKAASYY